MFFIVVMIASIAAVGLYSNPGRGDRPPPEDPIAAEETPPAALTFDAPARTIDGTQPHVATIKTDKGDIKVQLATDAPETVNSFAFLAGNGFYNNTVVFYVDQYWAQAGDPSCTVDGETLCSGAGGPGYSLKLENSQLRHEQWAVVAPTLGQGGEDIHGSQFRILLQADPRLDGEETVFGKVVEGQQILEQLDRLAPCSVVSAEPGSCDPDSALSSALVIREIIVERAAV